MDVYATESKRESKDERAHRIATEIILQERLTRERKTAELRAKRLAMNISSRK
jgi:hypothetical protein